MKKKNEENQVEIVEENIEVDVFEDGRLSKEEEKRLKLEEKKRRKEEKRARKMALKAEEKEREAEEKKLAKEREAIYKTMTKFERDHRNDLKVAPEGSFISLKHINKIYSNHVQAVFDFNLDIKEKEFIVFVGPSGCGKSTTLRMIAGLEDITSGDLFIDGVYANDLEPKDRDVAMVFQSYALYPHLTVYNNMAFGLVNRHVPKAEIDERVHRAAKILEIEEFLDRKPRALSGGQCQRVALGRAIVRNSKVFLMDEPLSNLDAKLRVQMRSELVNLHNELGSTTIYVTHDQTEAMTMASRIVVMNKGYIQQIGTPEEIYNHPNNIFVATFIGSPAMNVIDATYNDGVVEFENGYKIKLTAKDVKAYEKFYKEEIKIREARIKEIEELLAVSDGEVNENGFQLIQNDAEIAKLNEEINEINEFMASSKRPIKFGIRPEDIVQEGIFSPASKVTDYFDIEIILAELLGNEYYVHTKLGSKQIVAKVFASNKINSKEKARIAFNFEKIHLFDPLSKKHIG